MRFLSCIDPHVHLRGEEYKTNFLEMAMYDAKKVGLLAVMEMPNPVPWLTTLESIENRMARVNDESNVNHRVNPGLTNDHDQVKTILKAVMDDKFGMRSDKIFYTHSTGNMGILDPEYQEWIWKYKGEIGYKGVSMGHFEDEKHFLGSFDPRKPVSHSHYQTRDSELIQVQTQLRHAKNNNFQGTFYICHVSNPETIEFINKEKQFSEFKIVVEVTWHHMFLNFEDYSIHGNRVKMNPPLRSQKHQERVLEYVLNGSVDIIGTDHAPHTLEKKDDPDKPASGIPGIAFWPKGIELLRENKIDEKLLDDLIFNNANRVFNLKMLPTTIDVEYDGSLWDKYGWNPFSRIDK